MKWSEVDTDYDKLQAERDRTRNALAQLVDAVKRQYPSYKLTCSPEVVDAIADAESVIASGGASFVGVDGTVYGSAEERRRAEQQQLGDYERMKSTADKS